MWVGGDGKVQRVGWWREGRAGKSGEQMARGQETVDIFMNKVCSESFLKQHE